MKVRDLLKFPPFYIIAIFTFLGVATSLWSAPTWFEDEYWWLRLIPKVLVNVTTFLTMVFSLINIYWEFREKYEIRKSNKKAPPILKTVPLRPRHFSGRKKELDEIKKNLNPNEVVTLVGPGGIGKSALAIEAIYQLAENEKKFLEKFPDGIFFHSFYNQPDVTTALQNIAAFFNSQLDGNPIFKAQNSIYGKIALLVFDGAEETGNLPQLLSIVGECGVLVTSRDRKDSLNDPIIIETFDEDSALKLLKLTMGKIYIPKDIAVEINKIIGGLPLGIVLAGRYMKIHNESPKKYLSWLKESPLDALDLGKRQNQSIPVLLQRSLSTFSNESKDLLFSMGILAMAPISNEMVKKGLSIASDSIIQYTNPLFRFGILEINRDNYQLSHVLIHVYARKMLNENKKIILGFLSYFAKFLENQIREGVNGFINTKKYFPHILSFLIYLDEKNSDYDTHEIAMKLLPYLDYRGHYVERIKIANIGLNSTRRNSNKLGEATWLNELGAVYRNVGDFLPSIKYFKMSLAISESTGNRRNIGIGLGNLGLAYHSIGENTKAILFIEEALAINQEYEDFHGEHGASTNLGNLGVIYMDKGESRKAIDYFERALKLSVENNDIRGMGSDFGNLGAAYGLLHEHNISIEFLQKSLNISKKIGDKYGEAITLGNMGIAYHSLDEKEKAIELHEESLKISIKIGDKAGEAESFGNLGIVYQSQGDIEKSIELFNLALTISRRIGDKHTVSTSLINLGRAFIDKKEFEKSISFSEESLIICREIGNIYGEGINLRNIGISKIDLGENIKGIELLKQAFDILDGISSPDSKQIENWLREFSRLN